MYRHAIRAALPFACLLLIAPASWAQDGEVPSWADDLHLVMFGGPPAGHVEVQLNGEFVAEFVEGAPPTAEIADLLEPGVNELTVSVTPDEGASSHPGPLRIAVSGIEKVSAYQSQALPPLAQIEVPPTLDGECAQTSRFWAGPTEARTEELKKRYWLVVDGPPANHWFTVYLNDVPVYGANSGDTFVEVTDHVKKGKNAVRFEGVKSCMHRETDQGDIFRIGIVLGSQEYDRVNVEGAPLAMFEYDPRTKKDEVSRKQSFRGY